MAAETTPSRAPMRVLVTGSRNHQDRQQVRSALETLRSYLAVITDGPFAQTRSTVLIHGAAKGLDSIAAQIAEQQLGWDTESHPAQWREGPQQSYNPRAGIRRNHRMISAGADLVIGFPNQKRSLARKTKQSIGTWHCLDTAAKSQHTPMVFISWKPAPESEHMIYPYSQAAREALSRHSYLSETLHLSIRCQDITREEEHRP